MTRTHEREREVREGNEGGRERGGKHDEGRETYIPGCIESGSPVQSLAPARLALQHETPKAQLRHTPELTLLPFPATTRAPHPDPPPDSIQSRLVRGI